MEVTIHSTLHSVQGRVVVATDPAQTVDSLITAFCVEKGVQHHKNYVLRNKNLNIVNNHKKLRVCNIENGDILYLGLRETEDDWFCGCNQWWLIASIALLIGCTGLAAITAMHIMQEQTLYEYGVVIDGGSSHTQVFVYEWPGQKNNLTAVPRQISTMRIGKGLDKFEDNPYDAGPFLHPLLENATSAVPSTDIGRTQINLGATAGMRLLNASNKDASDDIMNSTRLTISEYSFDFEEPINQSRILSGVEEGTYSWVSVNYLNDVFIKVPSNSLSVASLQNPTTFGALDLGGASTQISFVPENTTDPLTEYQSLILYNHEYSVYTHSYLCYGVNEAHRQYLAQLVLNQSHVENISDPCQPLGHNFSMAYSGVFEAPCTKDVPAILQAKNKTFRFIGQSNSTECFKAVQKIFNFSAPCSNPPCTFDGVSMPPVYGKYQAFNGYYYPMDFLNITHNVTFKQFETTYENFCKKNWSEVSQMPAKGGDLALYCFHSTLMRTLLIEGYKFDNTSWSNIHFVKQVKGMDVGWSLGYMLNTSYSIPERVPEQRISDLLFILLVILFALFLGTSVGFACHAKNQRNRQNSYQRMATYGAI